MQQIETRVRPALAVSLFKRGELTSVRAAKLAHLSAQGIAVVDDEPTELTQELVVFDVIMVFQQNAAHP